MSFKHVHFPKISKFHYLNEQIYIFHLKHSSLNVRLQNVDKINKLFITNAVLNYESTTLKQ